MDATIKSIRTTPTRLNKDGDVLKEEYATITIEVPMDSIKQKKAVSEVQAILSNEWIDLNITPRKKLKDPELGND